MIRRYWSSACPHCAMKSQCTTGKNRRISRWEHESILDDHQVLDGVNALPDEDDQAGQCGDELACAGIQPETGDQDPRHETVDRGDPGLVHFDFKKVSSAS